MKKGFTLVELLAVIVIIAIIAVLGIGGIGRVNKNINEEMCTSTLNLVENGAVHYGEDFTNLLKGNCTVDGQAYNGNCLEVTIQNLINWGYLNVKETQQKGPNGELVEDTNGNPIMERVVVDPRNNEVLNDRTVKIYIDNNRIYAKFDFNCYS